MPKSKFLNILLLNLLFCLSTLASDLEEDTDACFFRVTAKDSRKIYILGSIHSTKIEETLPQAALMEVTRIATEEHPVLLTEHKSSSSYALQLIGEAQVTSNWASKAVSRNHIPLLQDTIFTEEGVPSTLKIEDLLKIEAWLAAPILSTHAGIVFYSHFGGTEYNLENKEPWKSCWSGIDYLEGPEHYQLLKHSADNDKDHNLKWINASLNRLMMVKPTLKNPDDVTDELEKLVIISEKEAALKELSEVLTASKSIFKKRGWSVVNLSTQGIPMSVLLRNKLWATSLVSRLSKLDYSQDPAPYFVVVGDGHLAGTPEDKSFLALLINGLDANKVERFINHSKTWKVTYEKQ